MVAEHEDAGLLEAIFAELAYRREWSVNRVAWVTAVVVATQIRTASAFPLVGARPRRGHGPR
jgi:hypothetical protein